MDTKALWGLVGARHVWIICGIGFGLGALGGLIQALGAAPAVDFRKEGWKRVLIGAVAAVAVLYVSEPTTAFELIGGSLVAGFAGQALLGVLEARTLLVQAKQRVVETEAKLERKNDEVVDTKKELHAKGEEARAAARERDVAVEAAHLLLGDEGGTEGAPLLVAGDLQSPPPRRASPRIEIARGMLRSIGRVDGVS